MHKRRCKLGVRECRSSTNRLERNRRSPTSCGSGLMDVPPASQTPTPTLEEDDPNQHQTDWSFDVGRDRGSENQVCPLGQLLPCQVSSKLYHGTLFVEWEEEGAKCQETFVRLDRANHRLYWTSSLNAKRRHVDVRHIKVWTHGFSGIAHPQALRIFVNNHESSSLGRLWQRLGKVLVVVVENSPGKFTKMKKD